MLWKRWKPTWKIKAINLEANVFLFLFFVSFSMRHPLFVGSPSSSLPTCPLMEIILLSFADNPLWVCVSVWMDCSRVWLQCEERLTCLYRVPGHGPALHLYFVEKSPQVCFFPLPRSQLNSGFMGFRPWSRAQLLAVSEGAHCFTTRFQTSGSFYTIRAYQHCLSVVNSARAKWGIPHPAPHPTVIACVFYIPYRQLIFVFIFVLLSWISPCVLFLNFVSVNFLGNTIRTWGKLEVNRCYIPDLSFQGNFVHIFFIFIYLVWHSLATCPTYHVSWSTFSFCSLKDLKSSDKYRWCTWSFSLKYTWMVVISNAQWMFP